MSLNVIFSGLRSSKPFSSSHSLASFTFVVLRLLLMLSEIVRVLLSTFIVGVIPFTLSVPSAISTSPEFHVNISIILYS